MIRYKKKTFAIFKIPFGNDLGKLIGTKNTFNKSIQGNKDTLKRYEKFLILGQNYQPPIIINIQFYTNTTKMLEIWAKRLSYLIKDKKTGTLYRSNVTYTTDINKVSNDGSAILLYSSSLVDPNVFTQFNKASSK